MAKLEFWTIADTSFNNLGLQVNDFLNTKPDIWIERARVVRQADGWYRASIVYKPNKSIISKLAKNKNLDIVWRAFAKYLIENWEAQKKIGVI